MCVWCDAEIIHFEYLTKRFNTIKLQQDICRLAINIMLLSIANYEITSRMWILGLISDN